MTDEVRPYSRGQFNRALIANALTAPFNVSVLAGLLIAGNTIEGKDGGADYFAADKIWLYVTLLTIGYMVSRGLAKSGTDHRNHGDDSGSRF